MTATSSSATVRSQALWTGAPTGWRNWARTVSAHPAGIAHPSNESEVSSLVHAAAQQHLTVKAVGAGHSFSGIAEATGVLLEMDRMTGLVSVDVDRGQATLRAGTRLWEVPDLLAPYGLAMTNLGDIDRQSLAGAFSTGTHGTGGAFGGLSSQVVAVRLVTGTGEALTISPTENTELWPAVRVSLGALGILTEVTLQCVPGFALSADERTEPFEVVRRAFLERVEAADHFEAYWFAGTDVMTTKTNTRLPVDAPLRPRSRARRLWSDDILENTIYHAAVATLSRMPAGVPFINRIASRAMARPFFSDCSTRVFASSRRVRFAEMEYALPREAVPGVLADLDRMIARRDFRISFPLEIRAAAADSDNWLSMGSERATGYIAVHRYYREDTSEYFHAAEEIFRAYDGRPHWGKVHSRTAEDLAPLYPHFAEFLAVRDRLDPDRRFANPYLERVLGA
jgi:FAD-linked oxidoreductase